MSTSIQEIFNISDQLAKNLEIPHKLAVPKIMKIVVNAGIGSIKEDNKAIEKMKNSRAPHRNDSMMSGIYRGKGARISNFF